MEVSPDKADRSTRLILVYFAVGLVTGLGALVIGLTRMGRSV